MKTSWDKLMRYAPEREYPLAPLQPDEAARIVEQTMQKAGIKTKKTARPIRAAALAAAIAALLCVSALAAYSLGWFDRLFGGSAALVESKVTAYDETAQYDVTLPSYTEQEQAMIVEGTMQVPEQAEVAETGVSAKTDEFVFTLDSMLASKDTLYAVLRIEARTQEAEQELAAWKETSFLDRERNGTLLVLAQNNTGDDYTKLYSLQIGDYFMPMSQTFSVKARKRLNVSALVDGPDIIQQTRKEAKTINCTLRLTLRNNQPNLQIMERLENEAEAKIAELSKFLNEFYEKDQILRIRNQKINETHGIEYAIITEYTDTPRVGMGTYQFEFTLTEVKYGENVVTFNLREVDSDAGNY